MKELESQRTRFKIEEGSGGRQSTFTSLVDPSDIFKKDSYITHHAEDQI